MEREGPTVVRATGIDGCNIIAFDGVGYAKEVAKRALELHAIDSVLAANYLAAMTGVSLHMENCSAHQEHHNHD